MHAPPNRGTRTAASRWRQAGFTLVELLMVVAIIGILGAIALPNYNRYVLRSHRVDATSALLDLAAREQRHFSTNNVYTASAPALGYGNSATFPLRLPGSGAATYELRVELTSTGFRATATPILGQANDRCGTYSFDQFGQRGVSGTDAKVAECW